MIFGTQTYKCVGTGESGNTGKVGQVMLETPFPLGADRGGSRGVRKRGLSQQFGGGFVPSSSTIQSTTVREQMRRETSSAYMGQSACNKAGGAAGGLCIAVS